MLKFKHPVTNNVVEVTEEFANQVLRPQAVYIEVFEKIEPAAEVIKPKYIKPKTSSKKTSEMSTTPQRKSKKKTVKV